jgi:hypothetical protein
MATFEELAIRTPDSYLTFLPTDAEGKRRSMASQRQQVIMRSVSCTGARNLVFWIELLLSLYNL